MARLRYNGLTSTLGGTGLDATQTTITFAAALSSAAGAVPTITGTDYIPLAILTSTGGVSEIVYLTAYTSGATTGTISRGKESTTGVTHASGDDVIHGPTALDYARNVCVATNTAGISIPTATQTTIPLAVEEYDSNGMHDTVTNNSRITIPAGGDGVYNVTAQVSFAFNGTGIRSVLLYKNGTQVTSAPNGSPGASGSVYLPIVLSLVAGDYLEVKGYQDSGTSLTATGRLAVAQLALTV